MSIVARVEKREREENKIIMLKYHKLYGVVFEKRVSFRFFVVVGSATTTQNEESAHHFGSSWCAIR